MDQVALCHQDEDRKTNVQLALDYLKLPGDFGGFAFHLRRRILDQTLHRDGQQQPVHWAVVPMLFQEAEELTPFARYPRFNFLKNQSARGVENDRVISEPPIHVDGAAYPLEFVLQTRRKAGLGMTNRFGLAGAGLSND